MSLEWYVCVHCMHACVWVCMYVYVCMYVCVCEGWKFPKLWNGMWAYLMFTEIAVQSTHSCACPSVKSYIEFEGIIYSYPIYSYTHILIYSYPHILMYSYTHILIYARVSIYSSWHTRIYSYTPHTSYTNMLVCIYTNIADVDLTLVKSGKKEYMTPTEVLLYSTLMAASLTLTAFSKGCMVLNQLVAELGSVSAVSESARGIAAVPIYQYQLMDTPHLVHSSQSQDNIVHVRYWIAEQQTFADSKKCYDEFLWFYSSSSFLSLFLSLSLTHSLHSHFPVQPRVGSIPYNLC